MSNSVDNKPISKSVNKAITNLGRMYNLTTKKQFNGNSLSTAKLHEKHAMSPAQINEQRQRNGNVLSATTKMFYPRQEPQILINGNSNFYDNQVSSTSTCDAQNTQTNDSFLKGATNSNSSKNQTEKLDKNQPKKHIHPNNNFKQNFKAKKVSKKFDNPECHVQDPMIDKPEWYVEDPPSVQQNLPLFANETLSNTYADQMSTQKDQSHQHSPNADDIADTNVLANGTQNHAITEFFKRFSILEQNETVEMTSNIIYQIIKMYLSNTKENNKLTLNQLGQQHFHDLINKILSTDLCTESVQSEPMDQSTSGEARNEFMPQVTIEWLAVMDVLTCQNCQKWMDSGCVHSCMCALVCEECASKANRCNKCGHDHKVKARVTSLHKRLAAVIPHFCSNKECSDLVVPGDDHATNCKYVPLKCPLCSKSFQNNNISDHFASRHPHQVLLNDINSNVLPSKFFEIPGLELPTLLCCAQGHYLSISIMKFEDKDPNVDFIIKNIKTGDDVNVAVKLIFKLNEYSHAQRNYKNQRVPIISIAKDKFDEWWSGSSTLEIKIVIRKKRNYNNGKRKRVTN